MSDLHAIEELAARGQKIQAIKEFRALTGVGLKEAKDAVEWFQAHGQWPAAYGGDADSGPRPVQVAAPPTANHRAALEELMASKQKIGAIKLLREVTQWGLRESKDAVDYYEAHGAWRPEVLAALGEPAAAAAPLRTAQSSSRDPQLASLLQAIAGRLGYAPDVRLTARARRLARDGQLVMLRDRVCFAHEDRGQWVIDPMISYDMVTHVETRPAMQTVLYVSVGYLHERFELDATDADAALALFRVFAP
jgi:ribosomal protein L7/L12